MAKEIYIEITNDHGIQRFANLITDSGQLLVWNKTKLFEYKSIYLILKTWVLLKL